MIAGTGSIVYAVGKNHQVSRVGGWGYLLGDEGSGYYIGQEALRLITRHYDAIGVNEDLFTATIMEQLALKNPTEIITHVYEHPQPRVLIASVARVVLRLAEQNNDGAMKIIEQATHHLVQFIQTMFKKSRSYKFILLSYVEVYSEIHILFNAFERNYSLLKYLIDYYSQKCLLL